MFPVLFKAGPFTLHTYGLMAAAGYLAAITYVLRRRERMGLSEARLWGLIYALFFGALLGGKLAFAAAEWSSGHGFWEALKNIRYGFVFYGGFLGSLCAGLAYAARHRLSIGRVADPFAAALPLGHGIGRLGCFAAGCCYGAPTESFLGVAFDHPQCLLPTELLGVPLHPVQLYEAAGNLMIFAGLHLWLRRGGPSKPGLAFVAYAGLYAALRFLVEFARADERGAFALGLSPSQWTAVAVFAGASLVFAASRRRRAGGRR